MKSNQSQNRKIQVVSNPPQKINTNSQYKRELTNVNIDKKNVPQTSNLRKVITTNIQTTNNPPKYFGTGYTVKTTSSYNNLPYTQNSNSKPNYTYQYNNKPTTQSAKYLNSNNNNRRGKFESKSYSGRDGKYEKVNTYQKRTRSPEPYYKEKLIYRGQKTRENIVIKHVIFCSTEQEFRITEKLNMENIHKDLIRITESDKKKLQEKGISKYFSSINKDMKIEPKKYDLKGRTTVYQHARGIGMTNDKSRYINPKFYTSEIKKMEPIQKPKFEAKSESLNNFRGSPQKSKTPYKMSTKPNYNYSQKRPTSNAKYNPGSRVIVTTTKVTSSNITNKPSTVKENNSRVIMGSRSQFNGGGK